MNCVIFVALLVILLQMFAEGKSNGELWKDYYEETVRMGCKTPQKRAFPVVEFKENLEPKINDLEMEKLLPQSVIVTRCEDSGCCLEEGYICGPVKTAPATLLFILNKPLKFFHLKIENHVMCECQKPKNHIK